MFHEITMLNYSRSLKERREARKTCGPYRWTPTEPGKGRSFYQASKSLTCDPHGSSFDLRLELANDHLKDSRLSRLNGYYTDQFYDTTLTPIIARLPHSRGFLAGWTMGNGMCAALATEVFATAEEAAHAAHGEAECEAEREFERQEDEDEDEEEDEDE
jgi:hypothetical protein